MPFEQPSEKQKKEAKEYWGEDMYELAGHYRRSISQEERRKKERGEPQGEPEAKEGEEGAGKEGERVETAEALRRSEIEKRTNELFGEKEKELQEKIDKSRTFQGEKLSPARAHEEMLKFYLTEVGYSVKYDALHNRARILDGEGKFALDQKTKKPLEFKTSFDPKGETPIIQFLKEELKNKIRKDLGGEAEINSEKIKQTEERKKKKSKIWELIKRLKM